FLSCDCVLFFFFHDPSTTAIYTLSLHDALPIWVVGLGRALAVAALAGGEDVAVALDHHQAANLLAGRQLHAAHAGGGAAHRPHGDRKSTRLNSRSRENLVCRLLLEKKKPTERMH